MKIDGSRRQDRATELLLSYHAAFNRADWDAVLALLTDDVVHDLEHGVREIGRDAFADHLECMQSSRSEQLRDVVVLVALDGDRAAAEYTVHGHPHRIDEGVPTVNGLAYVLHGGAFFEVREDRIARVTSYCNREAGLTQVSD